MVLHILSDDKFTDYAIKQFSSPEMKSEMIVIPSGAGHYFTKNNNVKVVSYPSSEFSFLLNNLVNYKAVVLHGIFWPFDKEIIEAIPKNVKLAWYFWGGEIYSHQKIMMSFLAPITKFLYKLYLYKKSFNIKNISVNRWRLPIELYKRIDYCLTSELEEYEYAKDYTKSNMDFLWYTCYSLEETIGDLINCRSKGENILFCNSAAVETNIFDAVLGLIRPSYSKHIRDKEILVPLSYGEKWIKNLMLKIGPLCFKHFKPIIDFLPRQEYNKMMLNCSTLILPYYSPAGQGNIITCLWLGMRVYLSNRSIALKYFRRIGIILYSFEDDFEKFGTTPLSNDIVNLNRQILMNIYSKKNVIENCENIIRTLEK